MLRFASITNQQLVSLHYDGRFDCSYSIINLWMRDHSSTHICFEAEQATQLAFIMSSSLTRLSPHLQLSVRLYKG